MERLAPLSRGEPEIFGTAISLLSFSDMACPLSSVPLASFACWRGGSTAGPSHSETFATKFAVLQTIFELAFARAVTTLAAVQVFAL